MVQPGRLNRFGRFFPIACRENRRYRYFERGIKIELAWDR